MIFELKPYAKYRDSGLPWLGKIPRHWQIKRGKSIFNCIDLRSKTGKEELLTVSSARGVVPRRTANVTMFKAESYKGYKLCWPGDLVINSLWAWAGGLGGSKYHGIISSAYGVYRVRSDVKVLPQFIEIMVRSRPFHWELRVRSKGVWTSRLQLTDASFLDAPICIPPPDEQAAIVEFLDWANGRTDRAIRAKKKIISLLNEQKQAIIHHAVTRGLDPNIEMKPSGLPWLGDIPTHWEVGKIGHKVQILRGRFSHRPRNEPRFYGGKFPFIQTGDISAAKKYISAFTQTLNEAGFRISKQFPAGTLAMVITGAKTGHVAILGFDACFPDSAVGFFPLKNQVDTEYLYYVFVAFKDELLRSAITSTQENLNVQRIRSQAAVWPPLAEQKTIVKHLNERLKCLDTTIDRMKDEIKLINEYQNSITAAVVTGKLDVCSFTECLKIDEELVFQKNDVLEEDFDKEDAEQAEERL